MESIFVWVLNIVSGWEGFSKLVRVWFLRVGFSGVEVVMMLFLLDIRKIWFWEIVLMGRLLVRWCFRMFWVLVLIL